MSYRRYRIEFKAAARRALTETDTPIQEQIRDAVQELTEDPMPPGSVPLRGKGRGLFRIRIGTYRVLYQVFEDRLLILVVRVGHRSTVYRGLEPHPD